MSILTLPRDRSRPAYIAALAITILLGLASRRYPASIPDFLGKYPGDALWAAMVFFGWGALLPRPSTLVIAALALATSFIIEVLKLYQAPWAVAIRHTTAGHLVFGHVFSVGNLVAYVAGVLSALLIEWLWPFAGATRSAANGPACL